VLDDRGRLYYVLTAGIDLAAQPAKTGAVLVDWSSEPPTVVQARREITDKQILVLCKEVAGQQGRVGIDCPLGWPRAFVAFVTAHAAHQPLPTTEPGTRSLRLRATDIALVQRRCFEPGEGGLDEVSPGGVRREPESASSGVADEATGDREQAQPKPFGFPAARWVVGEGQHLQPGGELDGETDHSQPELVGGEPVQRYLESVDRGP